MKCMERIAYREISTREKPKIYAGIADIELRQQSVFEEVCRIIDEKYSDKVKCFVALKTTIPSKGFRGVIGGKKTRKHFDITQAEGIPINYWADVLIFPVADKSSGEKEAHGKTLVVPVLSVRKRYGFTGEPEVVVNYDWQRDMMRELSMLGEYVNEIEENTFMSADFASKYIVQKRARCIPCYV